MTIGEDRVRVKFNPSAVDAVDELKQKTAHLINRCEDLLIQDQLFTAEKERLVRLAQTAYEEAAMWAVKAATAGK